VIAPPVEEVRPAGPGHVLAVCWRQRLAERALARRGVHFRSTDPAVVAAAYAAMSAAEFEAVNGRQDWANWRTIPRALRGRLPDRPWRVLDLGCGTGTSTRVLAYHAPAGSEILAYELVAPLLVHARRRRYPHRDGGDARVTFVCQGLTEGFRDGGGQPLAAGSADLANASGVVGHHLDAESARPLVAELRRVLAPGGLALLDDGPTLPAAALIDLMQPAGFRPLGRYRSWPLARSGQVAFRREG
jgi:SAM-dependent methyltransferase